MVINLYIWVVVAMGGYHPTSPKYEWRYMGDYSHAGACHDAAKALGVKPEFTRCISKNQGDVR